MVGDIALDIIPKNSILEASKGIALQKMPKLQYQYTIKIGRKPEDYFEEGFSDYLVVRGNVCEFLKDFKSSYKCSTDYFKHLNNYIGDANAEGYDPLSELLEEKKPAVILHNDTDGRIEAHWKDELYLRCFGVVGFQEEIYHPDSITTLSNLDTAIYTYISDSIKIARKIGLSVAKIIEDEVIPLNE